jgi:glycosyltransferase involved in cell wall biosynthesis
VKTLLLVAYFFPPLGGGGVQRSLKFARYLPDHRWRPIVLTARESRYWITDPSLLDELPPDVDVRRAFSPDGLWLSSLVRRSSGHAVRAGGATSRLRRAASWVLLPDAYVPWKPFALREARRVMRERRIDAIMTTSSPDSAHLVGLDLVRESGVPWVADFRDPWTRRISFDPPTSWHARRHERLERCVLETASRVVVTTRETGEEFSTRVGIDPDRIDVIPNGFDPADVEARLSPPTFDRFRLRYVGQLTAGRSIAPVIPVLEAFFARCPEARAVTDVRFTGPRESENDALVEAAGLERVVTFEGPCSHGTAVERLSEAHVILLVESMAPHAGLIAQGKLYECLATGRPVLGVVPRGAVSRLIGELGGGVAATPADEGAAVAYLLEAFSAWRGGRLLPGADPTALAGYDRRSLTARLARTLDQLPPPPA